MQVRHTLNARYQLETAPADLDDGYVWALATDVVTGESVRLYSCPAIGEDAPTALAEAHQQLTHPHIDRCTDFVFDDDAVYVVFRGKGASPVATLLSPTSLAPLASTIGMTLRVARALAYADENGFYHPKLSAATITANSLNEPESVKLIGLRLKPRGHQTTNYISGLGGLLYELLTGSKVAGLFGTYWKASALRSGVPKDYDALIERCMGLTGAPFTTIDELIGALEALGPKSAPESPKRRWLRRPARGSSDGGMGEFLVLPLAIALVFAVGWIITQDTSDQLPVPQERPLLIDPARAAADQASPMLTTTVTIESKPTGQGLWRDGHRIGATPMVLQVTDGKHRLQVGPEKPDLINDRFQRQRLSVIVDPASGATADVTVDLMPSVDSIQIFALQRAQ